MLIDLRAPSESNGVAQAFRRLGWQVQQGGLIEAALTGSYDLVFTDDLETLSTFLDDLRSHRLNGMPGECAVLVLSDSDDGSVAAAWAAGADWVVWRPFDPDDPLGTREFMP